MLKLFFNICKLILKTLIIFLPWKFKRFFLIKIFKFSLDSTSYIGLSWIYPKHLIMKEKSKIGHFNIAIHLDTLILNKFSTISRENWITGLGKYSSTKHFIHQKERFSQLILGEHSAITKKHHFDCTNSIEIGKFTTIAGYDSQFLTHSIDILQNVQNSKPIIIGDYCFLGTNIVALGGSELASFSVLGAKSLLIKKMTEEYSLYGGVPAKFISNLPKDAKYFTRINGFVN
jgi:acetyltransferase-like isoleucine patch superfamily enzyme